MKSLLTIIFSFYIFSACLTKPTDSLKKYSYRIMGTSPLGNTGNGTCFFTKRNGNLFLITAKHVVTGCTGGHQKFVDFPIKMVVYFSLSDSLTINTSKYRNLSCYGPDLIVINLGKVETNRINLVDSLIKPLFEDVSDIQINGFPQSSITHDYGYSIDDSTRNMTLKDKDFYLAYANDTIDKTDPVYYFINWHRNTFKPDSMGGFSGAPIFIKEKERENWRLLGLLCGSVGRNDSVSIFFVRSEIIEDSLNYQK